jgi:hypothetical protein
MDAPVSPVRATAAVGKNTFVACLPAASLAAGHACSIAGVAHVAFRGVAGYLLPFCLDGLFRHSGRQRERGSGVMRRVIPVASERRSRHSFYAAYDGANLCGV